MAISNDFSFIESHQGRMSVLDQDFSYPSNYYKISNDPTAENLSETEENGLTADLLPEFIRSHYEVIERRHACAVLKQDFPGEWDDIIKVLTSFRVLESEVRAPGGGKSPISVKLDTQFAALGWKERLFSTKLVVDDDVLENPTHKIDCFKNKVGIEVEWNSKDQTFVRDLNVYRLLFDYKRLSVGIIITRCDELQEVFDNLGSEVGKKYGPSTTHMSKLVNRIDAAGGCPILVFGISKKLYIGGK